MEGDYAVMYYVLVHNLWLFPLMTISLRVFSGVKRAGSLLPDINRCPITLSVSVNPINFQSLSQYHNALGRG